MDDSQYTSITGKDTINILLEYINYVFGLWDYPQSHLLSADTKIIEAKQFVFNNGKSKNIIICYMSKDAVEPSVAIYRLLIPDKGPERWQKSSSIHIGPKTANECYEMLKTSTVLFGSKKDE